jgi:ATP-binding cassette subfamily C protein CydD
VVFTNVTLRYPGREAPALDGVSVVVNPGDRVLLTGPSGAGKSSMLQLLLRFAAPTSGRISVGGTDLATMPVSQWRQGLAWVPQRPYIFAGTVAANIALSCPDATADAVRHAARLAGADDFITALPSSYEAMLPEYGLTLSAGQRQRIALARAFLRDAPLVLLDEPTAHLDAVSARQILDVIDALAAGRTVIVASHSEQAPMSTSQVVRLDGGQLVSAAQPVPAERADSLVAGQ